MTTVGRLYFVVIYTIDYHYFPRIFLQIIYVHMYMYEFMLCMSIVYLYYVFLELLIKELSTTTIHQTYVGLQEACN
jgi:hypothetical protein